MKVNSPTKLSTFGPYASTEQPSQLRALPSKRETVQTDHTRPTSEAAWPRGERARERECERESRNEALQRLVVYCRTTSASSAPRTARRTCCPYAYVLITVLRPCTLSINPQPQTLEVWDGIEAQPSPACLRERVFFIGNLLVRIQCIIVMIRWTGLVP